MKTRRWVFADYPNQQRPDEPFLPIPGAYDIKLRIDHKRRIGYMGPLLKRNPTSPYRYVNLRWQQGMPQAVVNNFDFTKRIQFQYTGGGKKRITIDWYGENDKKIISTAIDVFI